MDPPSNPAMPDLSSLRWPKADAPPPPPPPPADTNETVALRMYAARLEVDVCDKQLLKDIDLLKQVRRLCTFDCLSKCVQMVTMRQAVIYTAGGEDSEFMKAYTITYEARYAKQNRAPPQLRMEALMECMRQIAAKQRELLALLAEMSSATADMLAAQGVHGDPPHVPRCSFFSLLETCTQAVSKRLETRVGAAVLPPHMLPPPAAAADGA